MKVKQNMHHLLQALSPCKLRIAVSVAVCLLPLNGLPPKFGECQVKALTKVVMESDFLHSATLDLMHYILLPH